jgi:hypothetical protein
MDWIVFKIFNESSPGFRRASKDKGCFVSLSLGGAFFAQKEAPDYSSGASCIDQVN